MNVSDTWVRLAERRAALAWPAFERVNADGWWLRFGEGASRRANSALALEEAGPITVAKRVDQVEAYYKAKGLPARFQIANQGAPQGLVDELDRRGYFTEGPSLVLFVDIKDFKQAGPGPTVQLSDFQSPGWQQVYGGQALDGPLRCKLAAGMPAPRVFASVEVDGAVVATGAAGRQDNWALVNCMATDPAHRRKGLAHRVLSKLASWSQDHGCETLFLQVEEGNTGAQSLYANAGFSYRYKYAYRTLTFGD